ncbi:hypothetical protein QQS21_006812 [Conoideocrella luteorostrata]|uniref:F-box domain-containing protein n=1 Tax=Conoideocrella luteorostrata TaxID=1105319 RepID=A0AAJ0CMR5_9HYPO|nr:hypothetical protein QQS21_006812 [Conoideocrella luteorostrata]
MSDVYFSICSGPTGSTDPQPSSPLFAKLPCELRAAIFAFTLTDYEDEENCYDKKTCYTRPSYFSKRRTDTELLRTCRAIYKECWYMPFTLREQTFWLTAVDRAPRHFRKDQLQSDLAGLRVSGSEGKLDLDYLHVFAQMYMLEEGHLARLMQTPFLRPRIITLTIRHTDWWYWENDDPLIFRGDWISDFSRNLPDSVSQVNIELESLKRKQDQINSIAAQMAERWFFKRPDGLVLYPDTTPGAAKITEWRGEGTWHSRHWVRDVTTSGHIEYYIATVSFRAKKPIEKRGGSISEVAEQCASQDLYTEENLTLHVDNAEPINNGPASIWAGHGMELAAYDDSDSDNDIEDEFESDEELTDMEAYFGLVGEE